jgi:hypothetical protein
VAAAISLDCFWTSTPRILPQNPLHPRLSTKRKPNALRVNRENPTTEPD